MKRKLEETPENSLSDLRSKYITEIEKTTGIISPLATLVTQYSVKVISFADSIIIMESGEVFSYYNGSFAQTFLPFSPISVTTDGCDSFLFIDSFKNLWASGDRVSCCDKPRLWEAGPIRTAYFSEDSIYYLTESGDIVSKGRIEHSNVKTFIIRGDRLGLIEEGADNFESIFLEGGEPFHLNNGKVLRTSNSAEVKLEHPAIALHSSDTRNYILLSNHSLIIFDDGELSVVRERVSEVFNGYSEILIVDNQGSLFINNEKILH